MDLTKVDIFRLECLRVIIEEQHITRAAIRLGISQPKLSALLAQLRAAFGDPLLIKGGAGMTPTPFAIKAAEEAAIFLDNMQTSLTRRTEFDPLKIEGTIRFRASDLLVDLLLSEFVPLLRREAPNLKLELRHPDDSQFHEILERGEVDIAVSNEFGLAERLYRTHLADVGHACIVSRDHPTINGSLSAEQFLSASHIQLCFQRSRVPYINERQIDQSIHATGHKRDIAITLSTGVGAARIVSRTDLIATLPAPLAYEVAEKFPLQVFPLPVHCPKIAVYMIWHLRSHTSPLHRWVRSKLRTSAKQVPLGQYNGHRTSIGLASGADCEVGISKSI